MKKFIITEEEKSRILEMYQNSTSREYLMEEDFQGGLTYNLMNQLNTYLNGLIPQAKAKNITMNSVFKVVQTGTSPDKNGNPVPKYTINYGSKDLFQGDGFSDVDLQGVMRSDYINKIYKNRIQTKLAPNAIAELNSRDLSNLARSFDLPSGTSKVYNAWVTSIEPQQPKPTTKTPQKP